MTTDPLIGVIFRRNLHPAAHKFGDLLNPEIAGKVLCDEHLPLSEALAREWDEDAHLILYSAIDEDGDALFARIAKRRSSVPAELIQRGGRIAVSIIVLDYDLPNKGEWTEEGLSGFVQGLAQSNLPQPTYWYTTLHGCRWIYQLTKPVDHMRAEALVRAFMGKFRAAGIEIDESCCDWTRLFRLPFAKREDSGQRYAALLVDGGPKFDPASMPVEVEASPDVYADVQPHQGELPDYEMVQAQLKVSGSTAATDWVKTAKSFLKGREAYPVCFEDAKIDVSKGWNNGVVKLVGQIIGMTAAQENASPEGVYALLYGAIEQLDAEERQGANETDWFTTTWDIICRMWANEQAQIDAKNREREQSLIQARAVRGELLERMRKDRPQDVPADPEAAEEFLCKRMIASDGRNHYIMRPDSTYNINPVGDSMVVPMIRELGMEDVIEINEMVGKSWRTKSTKAILDEHATPIIQVRCTSRESAAYIDGPPGHRTLNLPVHRLNPLVMPLYSADIDGWLRVLFGDHYDLGIDWLSWALEVNAPICAINLYGAPGAGKGLLVQGLAECFEGERMNDGRALGKFNEGLLHTPVINCDEGVPSIKSDESLALDQAFRSFVSGGSITIRSMFMNPFTANIYPRIVFTSNDRDILRSIVGHRDLTDDDVRAIELRLLSICVSDKAREYLTGRGNYAYTNGWVHGKARSQYVLAKHIRYLYEHRKPSTMSTGRLLVEGEVGTSLVRGMRLRSAGAQSVLRALVQMIESPTTSKHGLHIDVEGRVWATASCVVRFVDSQFSTSHERLSLPRAGQVLRQFAASNIGQHIELAKPPGAERGRWVEIDLGVLYEETERYGIANTRLEKLLTAQPGGVARMAIAKAHLEHVK